MYDALIKVSTGFKLVYYGLVLIVLAVVIGMVGAFALGAGVAAGGGGRGAAAGAAGLGLLVGGKMTYTFLKARGVGVGATKVADEELTAAQPLLDQVGKKIVLPVDYVAAKSDDLTQTRVCEGDIPAGFEGVDIGPGTVAAYAAEIKNAGTVIWNGPVGWFEQPAFSRGTRLIADAMADSAATTVVGGGETAEAVEQFGRDDRMTHVSTGGGAFLAYVEGKRFQSLAQIDDR